MKTIAWKAAFQTVLRDCSKEVGGNVDTYEILVKGEYLLSSTHFCRRLILFLGSLLVVLRGRHYHESMNEVSAFLDMRRCKNWIHKIFSWKYINIWRPILPVLPEHQCLLPDRHLELFQGVLKISGCRDSWFNPGRGRWQVPIFSWNVTVIYFYNYATSVQFSSVAQSCLTLCDPMNHSTPGLPVHHQLPEFTQTHAHRVGNAIQP